MFPLYTLHRVGRTGRAGNEGFAFTFITNEQVGKVGMNRTSCLASYQNSLKILKPCICTNPSQDWYSGDIIRALELSGSLVPQVKFHTFLID